MSVKTPGCMTHRLAGTEVRAVSVGGLETCIELPGHDLAFDIGRCPPTAVRRKRVLVTHAHMDHAGGLAYHASMRDLLGLPAPTYYVPRPNLDDFAALLEVWRRLDRSDVPCTLVPTDPGVRFDLAPGRWAIPFRSPHRVYCLGYALGAVREKLKPEYVGLPGPEIGALRAAGTVITERSEAVEVAFTGDTTIDVVDNEPLVRTAKLLILEVTFLGSAVTPAQARAKGHVHLDDIAARADLFENEHLLLTHFSARHSAAEIREALDRRLPASLRARVTPLTDLNAG